LISNLGAQTGGRDARHGVSVASCQDAGSRLWSRRRSSDSAHACDSTDALFSLRTLRGQATWTAPVSMGHLQCKREGSCYPPKRRRTMSLWKQGFESRAHPTQAHWCYEFACSNATGPQPTQLAATVKTLANILRACWLFMCPATTMLHAGDEGVSLGRTG